MKTKDFAKKQTENKPKTKLSKLLKTEEGSKKQSENKPKNKAGHVVENKGSSKNKPKESDLVAALPYAEIKSLL